MNLQTRWRLEFSEAQQCFHQDCEPFNHDPYSNGYFTLLENALTIHCQAFIRYVRERQSEYISENEILSWRDTFITDNYFIECKDCKVNFNAKFIGVQCPHCQTNNY